MDTNTNNNPTGASNSAGNAVAPTVSIWDAGDLAKHTKDAYSFVNSLTSYMEPTGEGCEVLATGAEGSRNRAVSNHGPKLARLIGRCLKSGKSTENDVASWLRIDVVVRDLLDEGDLVPPDGRDAPFTDHRSIMRSLEALNSRLCSLEAVSEAYKTKADQVLSFQ